MIHKNITPNHFPKPSEDLKKTLISWGFDMKNNSKDNNFVDVKMPDGWGINIYQWYPKINECVGGIYDKNGILRLHFFYVEKERYEMREGKDNNKLNLEYYKIDKGYVVCIKKFILRNVDNLCKYYWDNLKVVQNQKELDVIYDEIINYIDNIFSFDFTREELNKLKPKRIDINEQYLL